MTRSTVFAAALLAALSLVPPPLAAQAPGPSPGGPPGAAPGAMPPGRRGPGGPPPGDNGFLWAQAMQALEQKASLLLEMGKTDAAIDELGRVYAIDVPKAAPVYELKARLVGRLANVQADAGRKKDAAETVQRLLADVPPGSVAEASAWLDAGSVYRKLGMSDEALRAFDRAVDLSQKLAASRGPAGREPPPGGRPPRPPAPQQKGDPR